jgi:hypothetical protein
VVESRNRGLEGSFGALGYPSLVGGKQDRKLARDKKNSGGDGVLTMAAVIVAVYPAKKNSSGMDGDRPPFPTWQQCQPVDDGQVSLRCRLARAGAWGADWLVPPRFFTTVQERERGRQVVRKQEHIGVAMLAGIGTRRSPAAGVRSASRPSCFDRSFLPEAIIQRQNASFRICLGSVEGMALW